MFLFFSHNIDFFSFIFINWRLITLRYGPSSLVARGEGPVGRALEATVQFQLLTDVRCS